jgi:hypothetical protein
LTQPLYSANPSHGEVRLEVGDLELLP